LLYFTLLCFARAGYGVTAPRTLAGKLTVIVYGLLGCSGCILFFNLFLERIITVLALMTRLDRLL